MLVGTGGTGQLRDIRSSGWYDTPCVTGRSQGESYAGGHGAAALAERFDAGYRALLGDLGIFSSADLRRSADAVLGFLPTVWETAEAVIAANPAVRD